ncbi:MAG TPA: XdhC family protein [Gaiellaceae bacterium]|jgi:xanthine dehydrogenase accessory factor|nr:XdhC family protein [Gaiellaceae bacterium]
MGVWERLREALQREERGVLLTVVAGEGLGAKLLVLEGGERVGDESLAAFAEVEQSGTVEAEGRTVLAEVVAPPLRLVVFGAVDVAEALCAYARVLGWRTVVVDPRPGLATRERLPSAGEIVVAWPDEDAVARLIDERTAVVSLVHEERLDVPAMATALRRGAFYVGALGSKRAQEKRRVALEALGVEGIDRIVGPVGLPLGGNTPPEIALSIAAEILSRANGG